MGGRGTHVDKILIYKFLKDFPIGAMMAALAIPIGQKKEQHNSCFLLFTDFKSPSITHQKYSRERNDIQNGDDQNLSSDLLDT